VPTELLARHSELLRHELNVSTVVALSADLSVATQVVTLDYARLGPRLRGAVKKLAVAVAQKRFEWSQNGELVVEGEVLLPGEFSVSNTVRSTGADVAHDGGVTVRLDLTTNRDLFEQGAWRDLLREVQSLRKEARLSHSDRAVLSVVGPTEMHSLLEQREGELLRRARVARWTTETLDAPRATSACVVGGCPVQLGLTLHVD
jgi:hypothetical protein